jgi:hypothetical protein
VKESTDAEKAQELVEVWEQNEKTLGEMESALKQEENLLKREETEEWEMQVN